MHEQVLATLLGIVRLRAVERDGDGAGRIFFAQALMLVKAAR